MRCLQIAVVAGVAILGQAAAGGTPAYRVAKGEGGGWSFLSPDGHPFFSRGVNCVKPRENQEHAGRDVSGLSAWPTVNLNRLQAWDFNTLGGWASDSAMAAAEDRGMPYTVVLHLGQHFGGPWGDWFDQATQTQADRLAQAKITALRDRRHLMGWFSDNELGWYPSTLFLYHLKQPITSATRQKLIALLREHYGNRFEALREDFQTDAESFEQLAAEPHTLRIRSEGRGMAVVHKFTFLVAEQYYRTMHRIIRKYDPDRLILGDRYNGYCPPEVARAAGPFVDVISTNASFAAGLSGYWPRHHLEMLHRESGRPVLVSEWYLAARENRSGNLNSTPPGAFPVVDTQDERARRYDDVVREIAAVPYVVGMHWFQHTDHPPQGRDSDGEDYAFGLMDIHEQPYEHFVDAVARTNREIHRNRHPSPSMRSAAGDPAVGPNIHWLPRDGFTPIVRDAERLPADSPTILGDLYVAWQPQQLVVALIADDFVDFGLFEDHGPGSASGTRWELSVTVGNTVVPATLTFGADQRVMVEGAARLEASRNRAIRKRAIVTIPARAVGRTVFRAGDSIQIASVLTAVGGSQRTVWTQTFRAGKQTQRQDSVVAPPVRVGRPGYWNLQRTEDGVWWLRSPKGERIFLNTVSNVEPFQLAVEDDDPHYVSRDWHGPVTAKPTDATPPPGGDQVAGAADSAPTEKALRQWAEATLSRIQEAGFRGIGAWSHRAMYGQPVPISRDLNLWAWAGLDMRLYDPAWYGAVEQAVRVQVSPLSRDRNLVGYYTDNELHWRRSDTPRRYFDGLAPGDPNRRVVMEVIRSLWPDVAAWNEATGQAIRNWSELQAQDALPKLPSDVEGALASVLLERIARDYFRITSELVRRYDPNHLILGVRYKGYGPQEVVRAAKGYTDAQSLNLYVSSAQLNRAWFTTAHANTQQPFIISEYAFHAPDNRSGNRNNFGFVGGGVADQAARAEGYRLFTRRMAMVPYIVGADWFQWNDEPPTGRRRDGEDVNFGVVDLYDAPYEPLVAAIQQVTPQLDELHHRSAEGVPNEVWHLEPAVTFSAPRLDPRRITIDGSFDDWPDYAQMPRLRRSTLVGSQEPAAESWPRAWLGWCPTGLYLAVEWQDREPAGLGLDDAWWRDDHIEFWIGTPPWPAPDTGYNRGSHHFFATLSAGADDQWEASVGQWHRAGDALAETLAPHPEVLASARCTGGMCRIEVLVPAHALEGWVPQAGRDITFNLAIHDAETLAQYHWSAPKLSDTHLRPDTWGRVTLIAGPPTAKP